MNEFDLIRDVFQPLGVASPGVRLGIGDDAALLRPTPGCELVACVDTLVGGVHFLPDVAPERLGHKALAVNLSDLAAMGARPRWVLLALTLPDADAAWLRGFATGLGVLARRYDMALVGGDTCRGPLSVSVTLLGEIPEGQGVLRSGAQSGDGIYVSGTLGDAAAGLQALTQGRSLPPTDWAVLRERLERPTPRVEIGLALRGLATAAIDLSDGLAADLGHLLEASGCGAHVHAEALPLSATLLRNWGAQEARALAFNAGDDYELCFTLPTEQEPQLRARLATLACPVTRIGVITSESGLTMRDAAGRALPIPAGYAHFRNHPRDVHR